MKDVVITVVDFFSWLGILFSTLGGYAILHFSDYNAYEYLGALAGFFGTVVRPFCHPSQPASHQGHRRDRQGEVTRHAL